MAIRGGDTMSVEQVTKSRIKKHFITDIIKTIDQDIHNEDHESIYNLVELMLGFEKNWLILSDYLTPEDIN
jgi:hypothetical protein